MWTVCNCATALMKTFIQSVVQVWMGCNPLATIYSTIYAFTSALFSWLTFINFWVSFSTLTTLIKVEICYTEICYSEGLLHSSGHTQSWGSQPGLLTTCYKYVILFCCFLNAFPCKLSDRSILFFSSLTLQVAFFITIISNVWNSIMHPNPQFFDNVKFIEITLLMELSALLTPPTKPTMISLRVSSRKLQVASLIIMSILEGMKSVLTVGKFICSFISNPSYQITGDYKYLEKVGIHW